jgi:hypothetical protein
LVLENKNQVWAKFSHQLGDSQYDGHLDKSGEAEVKLLNTSMINHQTNMHQQHPMVGYSHLPVSSVLSQDL